MTYKPFIELHQLCSDTSCAHLQIVKTSHAYSASVSLWRGQVTCDDKKVELSSGLASSVSIVFTGDDDTLTTLLWHGSLTQQRSLVPMP